MNEQKLDPFLESKNSGFLVPEFYAKLTVLGEKLLERNFSLRVACTVRGPAAQARLWCRSRSLEEVRAQRSLLMKQAPLLAALLLDEYAEREPFGASTLPGQSWHQHGRAADCFPIVGGKAVWTGSAMVVFAKVSEEVGLWPGGLKREWSRHDRHWHVQLDRPENALSARGMFEGWRGLERAMRERFEL
jgi:hypothetical protein